MGGEIVGGYESGEYYQSTENTKQKYEPVKIDQYYQDGVSEEVSLDVGDPVDELRDKLSSDTLRGILCELDRYAKEQWTKTQHDAMQENPGVLGGFWKKVSSALSTGKIGGLLTGVWDLFSYANSEVKGNIHDNFDGLRRTCQRDTKKLCNDNEISLIDSYIPKIINPFLQRYLCKFVSAQRTLLLQTTPISPTLESNTGFDMNAYEAYKKQVNTLETLKQQGKNGVFSVGDVITFDVYGKKHTGRFGKLTHAFRKMVDGTLSHATNSRRTHTALISSIDPLKVIHVLPKKGVVEEPLDKYVNKSGSMRYVVSKGHANAVDKAKTQVGEPYNYKLANDDYAHDTRSNLDEWGSYCSHLVLNALGAEKTLVTPGDVFKCTYPLYTGEING